MNSLQLRENLKAAYPKSKKWSIRVDKMPDNQLFAIFRRLQQQGKL